MPQPSGVRNFFGRMVDGLLPGNQYNQQTGQFSNVWSGIGGRAASIAASMYGGPQAGMAVNRAAANWINNGNPFAFRGGGNAWAQIPRGTFPVDFGGVNVPNVGMGQYGTPGYGGTETAQAPWTGLGTPTGNVVNGGALGAWANTTAPRSIAPLAAGVGRGGASVLSGQAAQDYFAAMKESEYGNRQMNNYAQ